MPVNLRGEHDRARHPQRQDESFPLLAMNPPRGQNRVHKNNQKCNAIYTGNVRDLTDGQPRRLRVTEIKPGQSMRSEHGVRPPHPIERRPERTGQQRRKDRSP